VGVYSRENIETRARVFDARGNIDRARDRGSTNGRRRRARRDRGIGTRRGADAARTIERRRLSDGSIETNERVGCGDRKAAFRRTDALRAARVETDGGLENEKTVRGGGTDDSEAHGLGAIAERGRRERRRQDRSEV
jgi:hypothetical protein